MRCKYLEVNCFCHYICCSIEAFLPSHLQKTQECRAIDGLSHSLESTCGHMWPPSKGWMPQSHVGYHHSQPWSRRERRNWNRPQGGSIKLGKLGPKRPITWEP